MTFKCVDGKLNPQNRKNTFEIMGYDFMVDCNSKPWLIEINTNPCIEETSKLLRTLLPRMLDDAFKLTLDVHYPPIQLEQPPSTTAYPVEGYSDQENMWQLVYN